MSVLDGNNTLSRYQSWEKIYDSGNNGKSMNWNKIHNKNNITISNASYVRFNQELYRIISSRHPDWGSNLAQGRHFEITLK